MITFSMKSVQEFFWYVDNVMCNEWVSLGVSAWKTKKPNQYSPTSTQRDTCFIRRVRNKHFQNISIKQAPKRDRDWQNMVWIKFFELSQ